jgi:hypothetical protein
MCSRDRSRVRKALEAAFELAGLVMAREVVDVYQDVVVSIGVLLLVHSTTRTVVRVVPVEPPTKRSIGVAEHPDLHYLPSLGEVAKPTADRVDEK